MTHRTPTLPTLPVFRHKYANTIKSLPLCQSNKNYNIHYYYIDIWQSIYQYIMCIFSIFIGIYLDIPLEKYGKLGNLANFGVYGSTCLYLRQKYRWQTFGKLGKLQ